MEIGLEGEQQWTHLEQYGAAGLAGRPRQHVESAGAMGKGEGCRREREGGGGGV